MSALYWIGCVEKHVQYMQKKGWIVQENGKFRFVMSIEDWHCEGEIN